MLDTGSFRNCIDEEILKMLEAKQQKGELGKMPVISPRRKCTPTDEVIAELREPTEDDKGIQDGVRAWRLHSLVTNTQALGTEYISELVDHGCRRGEVEKEEREIEDGKGLLLAPARLCRGSELSSTRISTPSVAECAERLESVTCGRHESPNFSQMIFFSKHELLGVRIHPKMAIAVRCPSENQWPESSVAHAAITTS